MCYQKCAKNGSCRGKVFSVHCCSIKYDGQVLESTKGRAYYRGDSSWTIKNGWVNVVEYHAIESVLLLALNEGSCGNDIGSLTREVQVSLNNDKIYAELVRSRLDSMEKHELVERGEPKPFQHQDHNHPRGWADSWKIDSYNRAVKICPAFREKRIEMWNHYVMHQNFWMVLDRFPNATINNVPDNWRHTTHVPVGFTRSWKITKQGLLEIKKNIIKKLQLLAA